MEDEVSGAFGILGGRNEIYISEKKLDRLHDLRVNGNIILKES